MRFPTDAQLDTAALVADQVAHSAVRIFTAFVAEVKNVRAAFPAEASRP